jgi:hypothetical protein
VGAAKRLKNDHRRKNQTTEECHKQTHGEGNGDIPIGYLGCIAKRREQCDVFPW